MSLSDDSPSIAILLCTYNGARFLAEQLDSLVSQSHQNWVVIASDDGSTDQTLEILNFYKSKWPAGKLTIRSGPQKGFCQNFLSLACDPKIDADYYAFCDQDDFWLPDKIAKGIQAISVEKALDIPSLYCSGTYYVNEKLSLIGHSPARVFPPSFRNALVQSIAGGNTMLFNRHAKRLLEKIGTVDVVSHDWWIYLLVTAVNGHVYYDSTASIYYRQHADSIVGGKISFLSNLYRAVKIVLGKYQDWNMRNIKSLDLIEAEIPSSNYEMMKLFKKITKGNLKDRIRLLQVCGLYRQNKLETLNLYIIILLGKL
jgi:glycosyltransferase involved in cell wall biosynthesis